MHKNMPKINGTPEIQKTPKLLSGYVPDGKSCCLLP